MTTINIERRLLERLYLYWLEDADPRELDEFTAQVRAALSATAPVLTDLHDIKEAVKAVLAAPATAPAWNNVPTCEGLWLCDEGDENPYRFTCHDISMPLNPHLAGEGERWYGPIPEDKP